MTTIRVPTAEELRGRLDGLDRLLTARSWERAAIVFAFTEVGEVGRGRWHKPEPPKLNIREFAAQGYAGLTTNKAVSRYRDAWLTAIGNGWAVPVEPGQEATLPDQPFPAWPYGTDSEFVNDDEPSGSTFEMTEAPENVARLGNHRQYERRPVESRVLAHLDTAAKALGQLAEISTDNLDDTMRHELVERLTELQRQTRAALHSLRSLASV